MTCHLEDTTETRPLSSEHLPCPCRVSTCAVWPHWSQERWEGQAPQGDLLIQKGHRLAQRALPAGARWALAANTSYLAGCCWCANGLNEIS